MAAPTNEERALHVGLVGETTVSEILGRDELSKTTTYLQPGVGVLHRFLGREGRLGEHDGRSQITGGAALA
jgi:hypothetical protein